MKTYLVGGAVRDQLLGIKVKDKDWVVVGATPSKLVALGFQQVGADFPVFLHPETKEEYALARTERKSGTGYRGFSVDFHPNVSLEEDLQRRDLTINAIAQTEGGEFIDPYNGQKDLNNKILRHVSNAFFEDPLRVLRLARFKARFAHLGFTVAPETQELMRSMSNSGELKSLTPERVWSEMERALAEPSPSEFFRELKKVDALKDVFPELDRLFGVPQPVKWHPEVDTGVHVLKALDIVTDLSQKSEVRFATLCHDLGKALTPSHILPSHRGHEKAGADLIKKLSKQNRWPNRYVQLATNVAEYHTHAHTAMNLRSQKILKLLNALKAFKNENNLTDFLDACVADARGQTGKEDQPYPQKDYLMTCFTACKDVSSQQFIEQGLSGKAIGDAIENERLSRIKMAINLFPRA